MKHTVESGLKIAFTGTIGAGKDTAVDYLADTYGFTPVSTGDVLRAEATRRGLDHQRQTLIDLAAQWNEETGSSAIVTQKAVEEWENRQDGRSAGLAVSGMRTVNEAKVFKEVGGVLCYVDADERIRYQRTVERARGNEADITLEAFVAHQKKELDGVPGRTDVPHLLGVKALADYVIINEGSYEEFTDKVDRIVTSYASVFRDENPL